MANADGPLVLVVDDEASIRQMEMRILQTGGYRVIEASGGEEALAVLRDGVALDLLIADLDMPELSGEDMVRRIHTTRPNLKVLYVTGNIDRLLDARSLVWEGEAFLDKPFTANGLLDAVSLLLTGIASRAVQPRSVERSNVVSVGESPTPAARTSPETVPSLSPPREVHVSSVLIVDDEPRIREVLVRWLVPAGYDTREAPDAETALSLLAASASDVVLSDVHMPGHDGPWLVEQLRKSFPYVAIVLATADDGISTGVSLQGGVVGYLVKPFERGPVLAAVRRAVEWHEAARARGPERMTAGDPIDEWINRGRSGKHAPSTERD